MQRVGSDRNPALNKFGAGKHGFSAGDAQNGVAATTPGYELFDSWQEELCGVIEGMGITLDSNKRDQLFTAIQTMQRGKSTVSVAGGVDVTLTAAQYSRPILVLTGALTANINLIFPAASGVWIVRNQTSGNFSVTCKTAAGTGVVARQGGSAALWGDGTNIYGDLADWAGIQAQTATAFTSAGAAPNFTLTPVPALAAYAAAVRYRVKFNAAGNGADTLNVSGLGAKSVKQYDSSGNKVAAVIVAGQLADVEYDGVDFVILDPLPPVSVAKQIQSIPTPTLSGNAMTLPSASFNLDFRRTALSDGVVDTVSGSPAALTIPSGTTLATINAQKSSLMALVLNNGGTLEYAVANLAAGNDLSESGLISTVAINTAAAFTGSIAVTTGVLTVSAMTSGTITAGMAISWSGSPQGVVITSQLSGTTGGAGTYQTTYYTAVASTAITGVAGYGIYSNTARVNVPYRVVGIIDSTQATAGQWATAPSLVQGVGGEALAAMSSLGYGQTWRNMTASRALSTTYYNTTGRPLCVSWAGSGNATAQGFVNGLAVAFSSFAISGTNLSLFFIVPPGATYMITSTGSNSPWCELR